jgi:hypothetical protein
MLVLYHSYTQALKFLLSISNTLLCEHLFTCLDHETTTTKDWHHLHREVGSICS